MKKQYGVRSVFSVFLFVLSLFCMLAGCHGPQYKDEEKEEIEEKGKTMMQAWLDAHAKGSRVLTTEADIYMYPSGPHYLTDYAAGTLQDGERVRDYLIHTGTGEVYLVYDSTLLSEVSLEYAFEALGLDSFRDDCTVSDPLAYMWLPDRGNSYASTEKIAAGTWMPGELVLSLEHAAEDDGTEAGSTAQLALLEQFVRSPEKRGPIGFGGTINVPDDAELEKYGMAYWEKQKEEYGIAFENFHITDPLENISTYSGRACYDRYAFRDIEDPDIRIFMKDAYWVEKKGKDGIETIESRECDFADLTFKKTEDGYLVTFPDYEHIFDFAIYADEDSEFRKHEYRCHEDREAYLSPGAKISGDRYFDTDLYWKEAGENGYILTDDNGIRKLFFGGEELIPRD